MIPSRVSYRLDDRGDALAAADAGGGEAAFEAATLELERQRQQEPRAGHAERDGRAQSRRR